ncbi:Ribosomal protein S18 acetylase RimI [Soonwooa buanensis]|uniref:Ribosomal protein S18 acetylase RimI n=1 Tax=Soonwooa buanensis TaxID=619805 RepID=A0A1T5GDD6_9FLAO|nr:GNAT family N-acetyltransferase [Soonwooa buanensis]SKC06458.1 Ribosomal protein S18 acetylase RimI [Soonwooa buanensis]
MIRPVQANDASRISELLAQMGYPNTESFMSSKISKFLKDENENSLVYEENEKVLGFISMHFIPQIAVEGDFARISYLVVDENTRGKNIGKKLLDYCEKLAVEKNCDRIELHSNFTREAAHRFYFREGYLDVPKYLVKYLQK